MELRFQGFIIQYYLPIKLKKIDPKRLVKNS